jgi:F-type H+-transporting ATPase subunit c
VNKLVSLFVVLAIVLLAAPAMAQPATVAAPAPLIDFSNYFGIGLVVIGAAFGIGRLASSAYEGMSRQPEVAGNIQTAMIIAAALIEGFTFYALFLCTPR